MSQKEVEIPTVRASPYVYPGIPGYSTIKPEMVVDAVCEEFSIPTQEIKGKSRRVYGEGAPQFPRHMCMHLLVRFCNGRTGLTLKEIGKFMGGRDHSTVIHSNQAALDLLDTDSDFRTHYESVIKRLHKA